MGCGIYYSFNLVACSLYSFKICFADCSLKWAAQRITADKRLRSASPKLPLATSFIRKPIGRHAAPQLVPKVGLSYNVEVEGTMMEIGIGCRCGIIAAAYRGARVPGHGAGRDAAQCLSAGFPADAPYVPLGHIGNPGAPLFKTGLD
jgi:hypothetical protein